MEATGVPDNDNDQTILDLINHMLPYEYFIAERLRSLFDIDHIIPDASARTEEGPQIFLSFAQPTDLVLLLQLSNSMSMFMSPPSHVVPIDHLFRSSRSGRHLDTQRHSSAVVGWLRRLGIKRLGLTAAACSAGNAIRVNQAL